MILHGNCLEQLKTLPDNSIDSIVTDPPYFLTNSSGSGFMGKEWDSLSVANAFAESLLKSLSPVWLMGEENIAPASASTNSKRKSPGLNITAQYVTPKFTGQSLKLSLGMFSVLENVLTKDEVLALSKGLSPNLTSVLESQSENVLYVLNNSFIQNCPNGIAQDLALRLATSKICEELETLHSLMADQKKSVVTEATIGKKSEKRSTSATTTDVKNVINIVREKRYSVTTSSPIELQKIIQWITSSRSVRNAMATFMATPGNIQILSERFHYNWAKEVLRVLKPGGHLLAFAGTRTYHPLASAIESAGFEIRDQIAWLFGSGFPKSTDVSKRIDKEAGAEREVLETKSAGSGPLKRGHVASTGGGMSIGGTERSPEYDITAPSTDSAKKWQGWGTALKPAQECICVARKPLEKGLTVAQNVQKWGTGAINIDESRIVTDEKLGRLNSSTSTFNHKNTTPLVDNSRGLGRWPANIILDEFSAAALDEQSGTLKSGSLSPLNNVKASSGWSGGSQADRVKSTFAPNSGGASRFFYVAKASKRERGEGNVHPTVKPTKLMEYLIKLVTPPNGTVLDPFMGSGSTGVAATKLKHEFVGIELSEEYFQIAEKRIELVG